LLKLLTYLPMQIIPFPKALDGRGLNMINICL